jgi:hypothetical protein
MYTSQTANGSSTVTSGYGHTRGLCTCQWPNLLYSYCRGPGSPQTHIFPWECTSKNEENIKCSTCTAKLNLGNHKHFAYSQGHAKRKYIGLQDLNIIFYDYIICLNNRWKWMQQQIWTCTRQFLKIIFFIPVGSIFKFWKFLKIWKQKNGR